ncbi:TrmB family transcriptional regulator [Enterobacter mori]|uniref:TrmB family transcriptional regulator n=1 Tax=Enterobacter mori TaxID=539813 RepID=UPI0032B012EA
MQNQKDMTEEAKEVFNALSASAATAREIAKNTHLSREKCQLSLTQLVMAGLSNYQFGCYKRLH